MSVPLSVSIATRCSECTRLFRDLCNILRKPPAELPYRDQVSESFLFDEVGRFQVWQGNVGAHRSGRVSLDYRLREAAHMRQSVLDLLQDLKDNIEEAIQILSGKRLPYDEAPSDSESSDSGPDEQLWPGMPRTELQQTMGDLHDIVSSLYEISLTIRNAAPRDRLLKSAAIDVSHFEEWDQRHIEHKYPQADPRLLHRLARANGKRRQHFKYLEKHHDKLALGIEAHIPLEVPLHQTADAVKDRLDRGVVKIGSKSIAPSVPTTIATKDTQTTVVTYRDIDEDVFVDDNLSETSSAASEGVSEGSELQIPAPPKSALDGKPFECPYCFEMMKVSSSLAWSDNRLDDDASNGVQVGGSEEEEDVEAQLDAFSDSDRMSNIAEEALADVPEVEEPVRNPAIIATAEMAQDIAAALNKYLEYVSEASEEITAIVSELFSISSALRELSTGLDDPQYRQDSLHININDDINVTLASLNYTFADARQLFGGFNRSYHGSHEVAYRNIWADLTSYMQEESGNLLSRRLEHCRKFLLMIFSIFEGRFPDRYEYQDLQFRINKLFKVQDDLHRATTNGLSQMSLGYLSGINVVDKRNPPAKASESTAEEDSLQAVLDLHLLRPLPAFLQLSKGEIAENFKKLNMLDRRRLGFKQLGPDYQNSMQSLQAVHARNRDMNVYPWDNNRVRLEVPAGSCDYINASRITLRSPSTGEVRSYIAAQGPTELSHIWRMVIQETSTTAIIIMLTGNYEDSRHASVQYFPYEMSDPWKRYFDSDSGDDFKATLTLQETLHQFFAKTELRVMNLEVEQKTMENMTTENPKTDQMRHISETSRKIYHYWYGRDDFMTDRQVLVELCRSTRLVEVEYDCAPRIVHCSTGSERTGIFIALDFLLGEIESGTMENVNTDTDMIFETVNQLRMQRMLMVTSLEDYESLYQILKQELSQKLTVESDHAIEDYRWIAT